MPSRRPITTTIESFAVVIGGALQPGFSRFSSRECWSPSVNVYQLDDRIELAVDLAGVDREHLEVTVEPGRLVIRGHRPAPDPPSHADGSRENMRILAMEIDYGPFGRTIAIPEQVELGHVQSEYRDGMLWITLPLRKRR